VVRFVCPHCNTILQAAPEAAGTAVLCGTCKQPLRVPTPVPGPVPPVPSGKPDLGPGRDQPPFFPHIPARSTRAPRDPKGGPGKGPRHSSAQVFLVQPARKARKARKGGQQIPTWLIVGGVSGAGLLLAIALVAFTLLSQQPAPRSRQQARKPATSSPYRKPATRAQPGKDGRTTELQPREPIPEPESQPGELPGPARAEPNPPVPVAGEPGETPYPPGPWMNPPPLGQPAGRVVRVETESQLQEALGNLRSGTTILIAPGTYQLSRSLQIGGGVKDVILRGESDDRQQVVIKGRGMRQEAYGNVPHGIMVNDATDVTIANLSVGEVWYHPITLQGPLGCERVRLYNVRLFDGGEQLLKSNLEDGKSADGCVVEYCVFEFTDTARHYYTNGMSVLGGANWVVANNLFRNLRGPEHDPNVGSAILFWGGSRNTVVEGNLLINCHTGISLGLVNKKAESGIHDHEGGIIRNNIIWRQPGAVNSPDVGISVRDSPGTKVLHNTVVLNGTFAPGTIAYRWSDGVLLANNLIDGRIWVREEARGEDINNALLEDQSILANPARGDLHLSARAGKVVPEVPLLEDCPRDLDGQQRHAKTVVGADE
jgi:hypothetical protein